MRYFRVLFFALIVLLPSVVSAGFYRYSRSSKDGNWYLYTFLFWTVFICLWFVYFRYKRAKDKKRFLKSSFMQAIIYPLAMFVSVFLLVNLISPAPPSSITDQEFQGDVPHLEEESGWRKKVENDFVNPDNTYEYVKIHYKNHELEEEHYEILNFYQDKSIVDDPQYRDVAYMGLAYCHYKTKKYDEGLSLLDKVSNQKMKYVDYVRGCLYLEKTDTAKALKYLETDLAHFGKNNENTIKVLADVYQLTKKYKELYQLMNAYDAEKYLPSNVVRKVYILNNDIINYAYTELNIIYSDVSFSIFTSALLITLLWIYYLYKVDLFEKESIKYIVIVFLYGGVFSFFAIPLYDVYEIYFNFDLNGKVVNDLLFSIFGIGAIEELVKIIPLFLILFFTKEINEPYDYVFYACVSALGFAFVENLMYLQHESMFIIQGRTFHAAIGHMCDSAIFAYGMVLARYRYNNFNPIIAFLASYLMACFVHGLYDFFLFQKSFLLFNLFFYFEISVFTVIVNNCINNSTFFTYENRPHDHKLEFILSVSLVGILLFQYTLNAFQFGIDEANGSLFQSFVMGGLVVPYFVYKLSRLDLVKGHWFGYYNSVDNKFEKDMGGSAFLSMFIGDSIKPNNNVGATINFRPDKQNERLNSFVPGMLDGKIVDRWVLSFKTPEGKIERNPYWFLVELEQPLNLFEGTFQKVLLKFKYNSPNIYQMNDTEGFIYLLPKEHLDSSVGLVANSLIFKGKVLINAMPEAGK